MTDAWRIEPAADDDRAYAALAADSIWNAYSIGDLAPPFRAYARVALAERGGATAACLLLRHPRFNCVIPAGDPDGMAALLGAVELPESAFALVRPEHRAAFATVYAFVRPPQAMVRMALAPADFHPTPGWERVATRLTPAHLGDLAALYASYAESAFTADMLDVGPAWGVWAAGALVAAAGTHAHAPQYGVAVIGNVYTLPDQRGHGYASAASSAVVADLLARGCRLLALNVAAANAPARAIYARLGFRDHCAYVEGTARLKG
ncbi:MAG TPA: GNAT family N-acetyltransferase [Ktedonobacterales bacterium]|nr:GNAT family N-acetyltransferase [Ktedonobacterales bacterium]